jgi:hypothetical protein
MYYETASGKKSNRDGAYTGMETHNMILEAEIDLVEPQTMISLGKDSENAIKKLKRIETTDCKIEDDGINYLFMPHISRTVTQNIMPIANLFITMGVLKKNPEMQKLGEKLKNTHLFE